MIKKLQKKAKRVAFDRRISGSAFRLWQLSVGLESD
jgi:hypothetical protein